MANFTDSRVIYLDDYAPKRYDPHDDTHMSNDTDYNEAYLRQHADSVWSLPSTPLLLTVDLEHIDNQDRNHISTNLEIDPQDLEYLELYVERIDGDVQYLTINDNRYTGIEDLPEGLKSYLDTIYFGDVEKPVITVSGARVNLWDAIRGEPETQQAFYDAGFDSTAGLHPGLEITATGQSRAVPVGSGLLGRVIDGIGRPIDGHGPLRVRRWRSETAMVPDAMQRTRITEPLVTGQRVIDGLLTIGRGQRVGLFAGSGVGKSTLMGEIAKSAESDVNVIAMVGERGREVRPFIEDCLGDAGLARSVVVVATSDQTPLMRIKAVLTAATIAEEFRDQGAHVLFFLDSLTRLAMAQRELGLLLGEPPGSRGYPPSVQSLLASVLERLGCGEVGAITGLITVLVDGDDMDEPITDAARGILDGHIILSRKIAAQGHYPAVDVLPSVSRVFREVASDEHQKNAAKLRSLLATHADIADLIQIGAYKAGTSPQVDRAVQIIPAAKRFLQQTVNQKAGWQETQAQLKTLAAAWPW